MIQHKFNNKLLSHILILFTISIFNIGISNFSVQKNDNICKINLRGMPLNNNHKLVSQVKNDYVIDLDKKHEEDWDIIDTIDLQETNQDKLASLSSLNSNIEIIAEMDSVLLELDEVSKIQLTPDYYNELDNTLLINQNKSKSNTQSMLGFADLDTGHFNFNKSIETNSENNEFIDHSDKNDAKNNNIPFTHTPYLCLTMKEPNNIQGKRNSDLENIEKNINERVDKIKGNLSNSEIEKKKKKITKLNLKCSKLLKDKDLIEKKQLVHPFPILELSNKIEELELNIKNTEDKINAIKIELDILSKQSDKTENNSKNKFIKAISYIHDLFNIDSV